MKIFYPLFSVSESLNVKSQILVRDSTLTVQPIHVDLLANGADLVEKLRAEFGDKLSRCEVFFGTTKVINVKTLRKRGVQIERVVTFITMNFTF